MKTSNHARKISTLRTSCQVDNYPDLILDLLVRGDFPRIHRYSAESRAVLQQLRYRQRLVKLRTMVTNSLVFMASSRGVVLRSQLKTKRGLERLRQIDLPPALREQRDELCQLLL